MSRSRPGDVPWRTAPTERPFPDAAKDATGLVPDAAADGTGLDDTGAYPGPDALRAPDITADPTAPGSWTDAGVPAPRTDVERAGTPSARVRGVRPHHEIDGALPSRRDADALPALPPLVAGDDPASRATIQRWMDDDRGAHADDPPRPYRVLPPTPAPPAVTVHPPARTTEDARRRADDESDDRVDEDPQVRAWREEREFEAQFGPWRAGTGAPPPMRRSTLVSPPVLLLVFVLIVVVYYTLTN